MIKRLSYLFLSVLISFPLTLLAQCDFQSGNSPAFEFNIPSGVTITSVKVTITNYVTNDPYSGARIRSFSDLETVYVDSAGDYQVLAAPISGPSTQDLQIHTLLDWACGFVGDSVEFDWKVTIVASGANGTLLNYSGPFTDNLASPTYIGNVYNGTNTIVGRIDQKLNGQGHVIYGDYDHDGYGAGTPIGNLACNDLCLMDYATNNLDCSDDDRNVNPGKAEIPYNGKDDDCNNATADDDLDKDGFIKINDCNDNDPNVNPSKPEIPGNGIDDDCNSATSDRPSLFERITTGFVQTYRSNVEWVDLDSDNDLDIIYTGLAWQPNPSYLTAVYENRNGSFISRTTTLPYVQNGSIATADYDKDGDADILLSGGFQKSASGLYENLGGFNFSRTFPIPDIANGTVSWVDLDKDNDLDFMLTGIDPSGDPLSGRTYLFENIGGTFSIIENAGIAGYTQSSIAWGDINGDGNTDLLITGIGPTFGATEVYFNNGNKTFTKDSNSVLKQYGNGDAKLGDFDKDGDLDALLSGFVSAENRAYTNVYENDGNSLHLREDIQLQRGFENWANGTGWVDYDNDGFLDIVVSGRDANVDPTYGFKLYRNNGGQSFTEVSEVNFLGVTESAIDFGDYDKDGDVDFFFKGLPSSGGPATGIYKNLLIENGTTPNALPLGSSFEKTVAVDAVLSFGKQDFLDHFSDANPDDVLQKIIVTGLPQNGTLKLNDTPVVSGQTILTQELDNLKFTPPLWTAGTDEFKFHVNDGKDNSALAYTVSITVTLDTIPPSSFERIATSFIPTYFGDIKWVDLDSDNDVDVINFGHIGFSGEYRTAVYENTNGSFTVRNTVLPNIGGGSLATGDYDRDGDSDILFTNSSTSALYENLGGFNFSIKYSFPTITNGTVSWADFDNDNDLDFMLTGREQTFQSPFGMFLYENIGGSFQLIETESIQAYMQASVAWGDVNGDGNLDFLITGFAEGADGAGDTEVYLNNGNKTFTKDDNSILKECYNGDVKLGDFDNDGDLDVLLSGVSYADDRAYTLVYENDGNSLRQREDIQLQSTYENWHNGTAWLDYNNDGFLDIIISGQGALMTLESVFILYKNNGGKSFTEVKEVNFKGISRSSLDFNDYDKDGDVDLCFTGYARSEGVFAGIYKNLLTEGPPPNALPEGNSFEKSFYENEVLSFEDKDFMDHFTDTDPGDVLVGIIIARLPQNGTLILNSTPVASGQIILRQELDNLRFIPPANTTGSLDFIFYVNDGKDNSTLGYTVTLTIFPVSNRLFERITTNFTATYSGNIEWADLDSDNDVDIIISGFVKGGHVTSVYENTNGSFTFRSTALPPMRNGSLAPGDYDGDGDLDILITTSTISALYENSGNFNFSLKQSFFNVMNGTISWADFDNDRDLDFMLTGSDDRFFPAPYIMFLYENVEGSFQQIQTTGIQAYIQASVAWGDINQDGYLDFLITGATRNTIGATEVYLNNGNKTFTKDDNSIFKQCYNGDVKLGDFDNDGDLDALLSGNCYAENRPYTLVYENDGNSLHLRDNIQLQSTFDNWHNGTAWFDYNNDGFLDVIITGREAFLTPEGAFTIYKNNGGKSFTEVQEIGFQGIFSSSLDFNDYDKDGDVDLCFTGYTPGGNLDAGIYKNLLIEAPPVPNTLPLGSPFEKTVVENEVISFTSQEFVDHFSDADPGDVLVRIAIASLPQNGALLLNSIPVVSGQTILRQELNNLKFIPGARGSFDFKFHFNDGKDNSTLAYAVTITVLPVPIPPVSFQKEVIEDETLSFTAQDFTGNFSDPALSDEVLQIVIGTLPVKGTLRLNGSPVIEKQIIPTQELENLKFIPLPNANGISAFDFYFNDSQEKSTVELGIKAINDAPSFTVPSVITAEEDFSNPMILQPALSAIPDDERSQTIVYSLDPGLQNIVTFHFEPATGAISLASIPNAFGEVEFTLTANDGQAVNNTFSRKIRVIIERVNDAPSFTVPSAIKVEEDFTNPVTLKPSLSTIPDDERSQEISYSIEPGSSPLVNIHFAPITGEISLTSIPDKFGEVELTLTANDGQPSNNTFAAKIKVTIVPVNDAPVLSPISDIEIETRTKIQPIIISVDDKDNPATSLTLSAHSSNTSLIKNDKITFQGSGSERTVYISPEPNHVGEAIITIAVNDGKLTTTQAFKITIAYPCQTIALYRGWNLVSTYIVPADPKMSKIFKGKNNVIVKDATGNILYAPSYGLNHGTWNTTQGYLIYCPGNSTIDFCGERINPQTPLSLINTSYPAFLPYYGKHEYPITSALEGYESSFYLVQSVEYLDGSTTPTAYNYIPEGIVSPALNEIGNMKPGLAYKVKLLNDVHGFQYPVGVRNARVADDSISQVATPSHFIVRKVNSLNNSVLVIPGKILESKVFSGDEIAVLDKHYNVAGASSYTDGHLVLTIWENDQLKNNDKLVIRFWDKADDKEYKVNLSYKRGNGLFIKDEISVASSFDIEPLPPEETLTVYPNPISAEASFRFEVKNEGQVSIVVFDMLGRSQMELLHQYLTPGMYTKSFDLSGLHAGQYIAKVLLTNKVISRKLSIVKE